MVRRSDEVCVEDLFPSSCAAAIRFDGHNSLPLGRNPDFFSLRRAPPPKNSFNSLIPLVIAIPDSGQFFSLRLRQCGLLYAFRAWQSRALEKISRRREPTPEPTPPSGRFGQSMIESCVDHQIPANGTGNRPEIPGFSLSAST